MGSVCWWSGQSRSSMLAYVAVSMVALHLCQAYPTYSLQGYSSVPAVPQLEPYGALKQAKPFSAKLYGAFSLHQNSDTQDVSWAKQEFMETFRAATNGLLGELAPGSVQDTPEVAVAKQEFFRIFESALNGMIETRFMRDTDEVQARKDQFFGTFDSAVTHLIDTVEVAYLEDTAEVQEAKERFFKFFQFAVDGLLYKLNPVPGNNVLPPEIVDFYIRDDADVATAKTEFDQLYRDALGGDLASAIAVTVLEENDRNYGGAVEELEVTLKLLEEVADEAEEEEESKSDDGSKVDFEVIDALLDAIDLDEEEDS